jgi:transcriptional regulator with XRE-family HTH domain
MMLINDRLKAIRKSLNVSQRIFAKGIFISTSYYAGIETGHRQVNNRIVDLISKVYNANKGWILNGQGEMFSAPPPDLRLEELTDIFGRLNNHFQGYILEQVKNLEKIQENEPPGGETRQSSFSG